MQVKIIVPIKESGKYRQCIKAEASMLTPEGLSVLTTTWKMGPRNPSNNIYLVILQTVSYLCYFYSAFMKGFLSSKIVLSLSWLHSQSRDDRFA